VAESLRDCDDQLMAISKCDEKIAKFEELLKQMRSDLYGSLETISDKASHTVNTVISTTRKKGVPKIISNIQLVPPRTAPREILNVEESDYCKKSVKIDMMNSESVEASTPVVNDNRTREDHPWQPRLHAGEHQELQPYRSRRMRRISLTPIL